MILTEDEAKTKWCPEARQTFFAGVHMVVANRREGELPVACRCLGSACMAWRWFDGFIEWDPAIEKRFGYCGKAGKP